MRMVSASARARVQSRLSTAAVAAVFFSSVLREVGMAFLPTSYVAFATACSAFAQSIERMGGKVNMRRRARDARPLELAERRRRLCADRYVPTHSAARCLRSKAMTDSGVIRPVLGFSEGTFSIVIVKRAASDSTSIRCVLRLTVGSAQISIV